MSRTYGQYTKLQDLPENLPKGAVRLWRWINWWGVDGGIGAEGSRHLKHGGRGGRTHCRCRKKHNEEWHTGLRRERKREMQLELQDKSDLA